MAGRPSNENLALARIMGDKTYVGTVHSKCNTDERYVSGGGCVHCARVIATEQRDARKYLKAHGQDYTADANAISEAEQEAAYRLQQELDEPDVPDVEPEEEARARFDEDLEDML